ncbi:TIGR03085 family protein [Geodermatophilus sp. DF01-2]|uniref:TIGR03085 family metal-binding protein n=1 Tax=Geodermatophilus sp. DF01-2 TaxID=2559610 RepID=UPI0010746CDC|nr:TIGR03085 family metal-binding protein [Geodermatophilus sp. DF01_2]TFV61293.1 TIGR03085 family protein [Geodermatophilus sp. DF01_2]
MTASSPPLAERERAALADLLEELGPGAPTCCAGWTTAHLAAHLVARERRPDTLPGYGVEQLGVAGPLSAWSHRVEDRLRSTTSYPEVVARLRSGPPPWAPLGWPPVAQALNTTEYAIHHEDVRRAQPDWKPRALSVADQDALWPAATVFARRAAGRRGLVLRRSDATGVEKRIGAGGRTVTGEPLELLLWVSGRRDVARVE